MKVKVYKLDKEGKETKDVLGEFEVANPTWKERKHMFHRSLALYPQGEKGSIDDKAHEELSDYILQISGLKEKDLKKYSMFEVIRILNQVFNDYRGLDEKKPGD